MIEITQFENNIIKYKSRILVQSVVYFIISVKKEKNPNLDIYGIMLNKWIWFNEKLSKNSKY